MHTHAQTRSLHSTVAQGTRHQCDFCAPSPGGLLWRRSHPALEYQGSSGASAHRHAAHPCHS
eukprot:1157093-Pelagomonas_calceolata.AAC.2